MINPCWNRSDSLPDNKITGDKVGKTSEATLMRRKRDDGKLLFFQTEFLRRFPSRRLVYNGNPLKLPPATILGFQRRPTFPCFQTTESECRVIGGTSEDEWMRGWENKLRLLVAARFFYTLFHLYFIIMNTLMCAYTHSFSHRSIHTFYSSISSIIQTFLDDYIHSCIYKYMYCIC